MKSFTIEISRTTSSPVAHFRHAEYVSQRPASTIVARSASLWRITCLSESGPPKAWRSFTYAIVSSSARSDIATACSPATRRSRWNTRMTS